MTPDEPAAAHAAPTVDLHDRTWSRTSPHGVLVEGRRSVRFSSWRRRYTSALVSGDAVAGLTAVLTSTLIPVADRFSVDKLLTLALGAALAWPLVVAAVRGYDQRHLGVGAGEFRALFRAGVLAIALGAVPSALVGKFGVVSLSVIAIPVAAVLSVGLRAAGRWTLHRAQRSGRHLRRVILVGGVGPVADLSSVFDRDLTGMTVLGVCTPDHERDRAGSAGLQVLGSLDDVAFVVRSSGADAVAVTSGEATPHTYLKQLAWSLEGTDVELLVHPGLVEVAGPRMHIRPHVGLPLLHVEQPNFAGWRRWLKRAVDVVLTSIFLLLSAPLFVLVAAAIKIEGSGPVFFKQVRIGLDGSTFTMWKFRSMYADAEERLLELRRLNPSVGLLFKMHDDPRVTRVGRLLRKFSLDELPQLVNVLSGSMSLVGPRPPLPAEVASYEKHVRRRLLVAPGLTGLWQVSGRSLLSWEESVRLDLRYVENWSLTLDLLILWKTVAAVLGRRGAF